MPTVTDRMRRPGLCGFCSRRDWLGMLGKLSLVAVAQPLHARTASGVSPHARQLAAAWQIDQTHQVGWLSLSAAGDALEIAAAIDVPTRAHGLWVDAQGRLLAVARRPGDWMLRWSPGAPAQWHWMADGRSFNGHVALSPDGRQVLTTETDLETGMGWLGVRDAASLDLIHHWPTHGRDPHQLIWDRLAPGRLLIANGGIETRPETGRAKLGLAQMDSSLVRLNPAGNGQLEGQWRLADPRLSLRHLAWNADRLGVALQAEHEDADTRAQAPVLALFDGTALKAWRAPHRLAGYGGDIAAANDGFVVGCPRAGGIAHFRANGDWIGFEPLPEACALASDGDGGVWAAGHPGVVHHARAGADKLRPGLPSGLRLDNHWLTAVR